MKKILVTGGFGFIGTTLIDILTKDQECHVHVIDDLSTSPIILEDYLTQIGNRKNLTYEITTINKFLYIINNNAYRKYWQTKKFI